MFQQTPLTKNSALKKSTWPWCGVLLSDESLLSLNTLSLTLWPLNLPSGAHHCLALVRCSQWSAGCLVTPPKTSTSRLVHGTTLPSIPVLQWARAESSMCESGRSHMLNSDSSPTIARDASKRRPPIELCKKQEIHWEKIFFKILNKTKIDGILQENIISIFVLQNVTFNSMCNLNYTVVTCYFFGIVCEIYFTNNNNASVVFRLCRKLYNITFFERINKII